VKDSNLRRRKPTDLQAAKISGSIHALTCVDAISCMIISAVSPTGSPRGAPKGTRNRWDALTAPIDLWQH